MDVTEGSLRALGAAIRDRSVQIVEALRALDDDALRSPSELPHWSRLTIACHLRYGAEALRRMTEATLGAEPAAYYPEGRAKQRPRTLVPHDDETPPGVVTSLARHNGELQQAWAALDLGAWNHQIVEPANNPDLGSISLADLPLLRLTEVEIHGSDLGLGLPDWSDLFVRTVLPVRLTGLNVRRTNHRAFDANLEGSWLLVATNGPTYRIDVRGHEVESLPADPDASAKAVIESTSRDLLALLLGRPSLTPPRISGDVAFGESFSAAFPGP